MAEDCAFCGLPLPDDQAAKCPVCGEELCSEECLREHLHLAIETKNDEKHPHG